MPALQAGAVQVGIDLVDIRQIAASLASFEGRFAERFFTAGEIAYAYAAPDLVAERLAARFAAKEAAIKALRIESGIDWKAIEVRRLESGACDLLLHGAVAARYPDVSLAVSMSHEGAFATAIVVAQFSNIPTPGKPEVQ